MFEKFWLYFQPLFLFKSNLILNGSFDHFKILTIFKLLK